MSGHETSHARDYSNPKAPNSLKYALDIMDMEHNAGTDLFSFGVPSKVPEP